MKQIEAPQATSGLEAFVIDEGQQLLRFAFLLTGGRSDDARDLVQTVLTRLVARGIDDLDDPGTYARRAIVNEHRSLERRARTRIRALSLWRASIDDSSLDASPVDRIALINALADLTPRQRTAIVLRFYECLDDTETAEALGCSRATVRSLVHRSMPTLRAALEHSTNRGAQ